MIEFPKEIELTVTQEDLVQGKPLDSCACPAALALNRLFRVSGLHVNACNTQDVVIMAPDETAYRVYRSPELHQFIIDFDFGYIDIENAKDYNFLTAANLGD